MRRTILAAFAATLLGSTAYAQPLRVALREDPDILDPTLSRTYVGRIVFAAMCDKLFDINEKLEPVPQLATGYEWTSPTELVIKLRPGVTFHDGTKMDAEAVKYSLNRHATMAGSFRRAELSAMDRVEVVDPLTVKVVLKEPSSPFLAQLLDRSGMIVSPKAAEAAGKDFGLKPVCAGPYSFVERVPQDHITLQRFNDYWDAGSVKIDQVIYRPIPDTSVRLANLQAGSIEMSEITPTDAPTVKGDASLKLIPVDVLGYQTIEFNLGNGPRAQTPMGQNALVRRAFEAAIDREALVQVVYNGLLTPTVQASPPTSPFFIKELKPAGRDVAKAKALLKEAGVTVPVVVNLTVPNNPDLRQVGEVIQAMASEAGFDVKLQASEYASALAAATRGEFEAFLTAWSGRVDPDGNLYSFLHTGGPLNDGKYSNARVDAALDKARQVSGLEERRAAYADMWDQERKDLPLLYLWQLKNLVATSKKVDGYRPIADGMIRIQGMTLAK